MSNFTVEEIMRAALQPEALQYSDSSVSGVDFDTDFDAYVAGNFDDDVVEEVGRRGRFRNRFKKGLAFLFGGPAGLALAARRQRKQASSHRRSVAPSIRLGQTAMRSHYGSQRPVGSRRKVVGFGSTTIAAGETKTITIDPKKDMIPDELKIHAPTEVELSALFITKIDIGGENQVLGGEVPCALFGANVLSSPLALEANKAGVPITIDIRNAGAAAVNVGGALFGDTN